MKETIHQSVNRPVRRMKNFFYVLALLTFVVFACRKRQPDMTPLLEDCSCANEVSADFFIEEAHAYNNNVLKKFTVTDSIFGGKVVRFRALEEGAEYTWYLGQETEVGSSEVVKTFPGSYIGQSLPVTLVVRKKPNYICFPNDDGYDSITKYVTVAMSQDDYFNRTDVPLAGNFRVKSNTMPDSVDISSVFYRSSSGQIMRFVIHNIPNHDNADSLYDLSYPQNYRQFWGHMSQYLVDFHHRIDGKVVIQMENLISGQPSQYFEGRKL